MFTVPALVEVFYERLGMLNSSAIHTHAEARREFCEFGGRIPTGGRPAASGGVALCEHTHIHIDHVKAEAVSASLPPGLNRPRPMRHRRQPYCLGIGKRGNATLVRT